MTFPALPFPSKKRYLGTSVDTSFNMPYTQLLQMTGEQTMPGYYNQGVATQDFGVPSCGSLDSGYAELNPFEKTVQYQNTNNLKFDQDCKLGQQVAGTSSFNPYGYAPTVPQQDVSGFNMYPQSELATSFQPMLDPLGSYGQYQLSPGHDEVSEDERSASLCSESSQQISFGLETSPRLQQQSLWSDRSTDVKHQPIESPLGATFNLEERVIPKAAPTRGRPRKRIPHTAVERRYRENLNAHLEKLRAAVPNLISAQRRKSTDGSDPLKPSKCEVLMGAVEYIQRLEADNERLKRKSIDKT